MEQFDVRPGARRKAFAAVIAIVAIFIASSGALSGVLISASALLFAYDLAFIPGPALNRRLGEIYAMARRGWKVPWRAKLLDAAGFVLLVTGLYLQWQGR